MIWYSYPYEYLYQFSCSFDMYWLQYIWSVLNGFKCFIAYATFSIIRNCLSNSGPCPFDCRTIWETSWRNTKVNMFKLCNSFVYWFLKHIDINLSLFSKYVWSSDASYIFITLNVMMLSKYLYSFVSEYSCLSTDIPIVRSYSIISILSYPYPYEQESFMHR